MLDSVLSILNPIIVLGVLIVVHEFGHFIVAKWCGVGVVRFSVGFGPILFKRRYGETVYQLCLIPLGGYVRMLGDMPDMITGAQATDELVRNDESDVETDVSWDDDIDEEMLADRSRWFLEKGLVARSLIVAAGPVFNFVLAFVLILFSFWFYGKEAYVDNAKIGTVLEKSPAQIAGIIEGDLITALDGKPVKIWEDFAKGVSQSGGEKLVVSIQRGDLNLEVPVIPGVQKRETEDGGVEISGYMVGVHRASKIEEIGAISAIGVAAQWTWRASVRTVWGVWQLLSGQASAKELAGPVFILGEANRQAKKGLRDLLVFMAILSVSLAVLNLLPIPVLDGGHLLFFLFEAILGPISVRKKEVAQTVGMLMLLGLMGFAISNDFMRDPEKMQREESTWKGVDKNQLPTAAAPEPASEEKAAE